MNSSAPPRPPYQPPTGDEPLDAIEQELVQMWADIIEAKLRAELAADHRDPDRPADADARREATRR